MASCTRTTLGMPIYDLFSFIVEEEKNREKALKNWATEFFNKSSALFVFENFSNLAYLWVCWFHLVSKFLFLENHKFWFRGRNSLSFEYSRVCLKLSGIGSIIVLLKSGLSFATTCLLILSLLSYYSLVHFSEIPYYVKFWPEVKWNLKC